MTHSDSYHVQVVWLILRYDSFGVISLWLILSHITMTHSDSYHMQMIWLIFSQIARDTPHSEPYHLHIWVTSQREYNADQSEFLQIRVNTLRSGVFTLRRHSCMRVTWLLECLKAVTRLVLFVVRRAPEFAATPRTQYIPLKYIQNTNTRCAVASNSRQRTRTHTPNQVRE